MDLRHITNIISVAFSPSCNFYSLYSNQMHKFHENRVLLGSPVTRLNLPELPEVFLLQCSHLGLQLRSFCFCVFYFKYIQFDPVRFFTFGRWLHGDLVTEVAAARGGHSCSPDQVLLPVVEVGDSVEEKLRVGFVLTGHLRRHSGECRVQGEHQYDDVFTRAELN